jgi:ubiquinone/menaquinone biosynthesis C-methylase UbiE
MTDLRQARIYQMRDYIFQHQHPPAANRILDLGCGDGARSIALAGRRFNRVTGIDTSESLLELARNRARRRNINVEFLRADPHATSLEAASFDEVLILGGLFGHGKTPRSDVELLLEAQRLLRRGGALKLSFSDGAWLRENIAAESVEPLSGGFAYRHKSIVDHGHCLKTEIVSADEETGVSHRRTMLEWLYTARDVSDLLHRLGFRAISYDPKLEVGLRAGTIGSAAPVRMVHCIAPPGNSPRLTLASG